MFHLLRSLGRTAALPLCASIAASIAPVHADVPVPAADPTADRTLSPCFQVEGAESGVDALPLKSTHVDVRVLGVIADVTVTQRCTRSSGRAAGRRQRSASGRRRARRRAFDRRIARGPRAGVAMTTVVNLDEKLARIGTYFDPKIVAELNGQQVRLVKFASEFVWHRHEHEDEMFLVLHGEFDMQFRDRTERVRAGEFVVVPRGVEHCPKAEREVAVLLFEPATTLNTGTAGGERTVVAPARL